MIDRPVPPGTVRHIDDIAAEQTARTAMRREAHRADEAAAWQGLLEGNHPLPIPARASRRVIIDLNNYYCGYAQVILSGGEGARVRLRWAEAAFESDPTMPSQGNREKGNRDALEGKFFLGRGDAFVADGGKSREYRGLWWMAGRYIEVQVETEDEPLTLDSLGIRETRYPLEKAGSVFLSDENFQRLAPILWRTLQMCAHETYMDCPYYEQLMYTGDTRLQALVTYVMADDDRLPRKAIDLFGSSLASNGLTQARYPSAILQIIPQFSLYWVAMLHDFALWRGDRERVCSLMPNARAVLETFIHSIRPDGLLFLPEGWDWADWVDDWAKDSGGPPHGKNGVSAINHWQFVMVLTLAAELETWLEEPLLAQRLRGIQSRLVEQGIRSFWNEERGLFADTTGHDSFSEHVQCLAVLSRRLDPEKLGQLRTNLGRDSGLVRGTYYFQHYLFEAWRELGMAGFIPDRLKEWNQMMELGAKTGFEKPDPTRSDCHAWCAHPLFHAATSIVGIRPGGLGFKDVAIQPQLGALERAEAEVMHPGGGRIIAKISRRGHDFKAEITLPQAISGTLRDGPHSFPLRPGAQTVEWTELRKK